MARVTPERREQLLGYVQDSIQKLKAGEISRLPTLQDLANLSGYKKPDGLSKFLRSQGINLHEYDHPYRLPEPSADLAWFLGIVSAGGGTRLDRGRFRLKNSHANVLEKYKLLGERLFSLNASRINNEEPDSWRRRGYEFNNVKVGRFLGDLRRVSWARTILSQHPWIVDNPEYTWGFISGFFEKRGGVDTNEESSYFVIRLTAPSQSGANLLAEMLVRGGVEHPYIQYASGDDDEKPRGVWICNLKDIRHFSQQVHSVIPEKEERLEHYRTRFPKRGFRKHPDEQLIEEWERIKKELGKIPSGIDIRKLKKESKTDISYVSYANRFGGGSFIKARKELERISRELRIKRLKDLPKGAKDRARKKELIAYTEDNIQRLEAGEITSLPTYKEIADQFGYADDTSVYTMLKRRGIKLREYAPSYKLPAPSSDLAWFLGIVSAGGYVNLGKEGTIQLENVHENLLENYRLLGERLFSLNVHKMPIERESGKSWLRYEFYNTRVARFLGDLRRDCWARTILSMHPWIVDNSQYAWGFINGFFDKKGTVYTDKKTHINISIPSPSGASLLAEMLVKQGLEHPTIHYTPDLSNERVMSVQIHNLRGVRLFAQNVHSLVPEKEAALEYCRTRFSLSGRYDNQPKYTRERLIEEWRKISDVVGKSPSSTEIQALTRAKETEISALTFARRFGGGSFIKAREILERIITGTTSLE